MTLGECIAQVESLSRRQEGRPRKGCKDWDPSMTENWEVQKKNVYVVRVDE